MFPSLLPSFGVCPGHVQKEAVNPKIPLLRWWVLWLLPGGGTGGILVLLLLEGMQCSLPSKDWSNSSSFIALGVPCPCPPSALLALGTLSSQLVLNMGWISPFSGIPVHSEQDFQPAAAHPKPDHTGVKPSPFFCLFSQTGIDSALGLLVLAGRGKILKQEKQRALKIHSAVDRALPGAL